MLKVLKERSQKRRLLLAQQLGAGSVDNLSIVLGNQEDKSFQNDKQLNTFASKENEEQEKETDSVKKQKTDGEGDYEEESERNLDFAEEEVYTGSSTFLKVKIEGVVVADGSVTVLLGEREPFQVVEDDDEQFYGLNQASLPILQLILQDFLQVMPQGAYHQTQLDILYLKCDMETFELRELNCKFDVILVEPPLEEYQRSQGVSNSKFWTWDEIIKLEIEEVAAPRSFIFLWCGSSDGLDLGRQCLRRWGFRRCEDICWIKTNIKNPSHSKNLEPRAIFQRTKEHCLMGIKGTVRRSTDGDFIHANVDIDLIISEETEYGSLDKPEEIFHIIEHFCLGRRRLHIFGRDTTIRPGWLTIGPELTNSNFNSETYNAYFNKGPNEFLTGCTDRIEALRPKSPPPKGKGVGGTGSSARGGSVRGGSQSRGGPGGRGKVFGGRGRGRGR
ncbi:methyltransferase-like protein 14 homolog [Limulus polyphemus]|uniref:N(6)-adenosine-methyltransferase non-catalytic subunit METTL14 n=1 Tax=Limulus polyphemus TaxID=6850 RepID=A0ABM1SRT9_LIMPO|nr:methyltransferase-like protein 14 homolog [Limulus polyphemus]